MIPRTSCAGDKDKSDYHHHRINDLHISFLRTES
jgi:hypothetical protein